MAVQLTSSPTAAPEYLAISDCMKWCLQAQNADVYTTVGAAAKVVAVFPSTCTVPSNGTTFKIWGYDFTVQSGSLFSSTSYKVVTSGAETAANFKAMIEANFFFRQATREEQSNFTGANMAFGGITGTGASCTATNGTSPDIRDGYGMSVTLFTDVVNGGFSPLTATEGILPKIGCAAAQAECVDMMPKAKSLVYTPMPRLDGITHPTHQYNTVKKFALLYGDFWRDNCNPQSGLQQLSGTVLLCNATFEPNDALKFRPYAVECTGGLPSGQTRFFFLTTQPKKHVIHRDSFVFLWMLANESDPTFAGINVTVATFSANGTQLQDNTFSAPNPYRLSGLSAFNVSPAFISDTLGLTMDSTVAYYTVSATGIDNTIGADVLFRFETITYIFNTGCSDADETTDLYFVTSPGGIGTLPMTVQSVEYTQEGSELDFGSNCSTDVHIKSSTGGQTLSVSRNYKSVTLSTIVDSNEEIERYFSDMRKSPQRWVRVADGNGGWAARKFLVDTGAIEVRRIGEAVELTVRGNFQNETAQSNTEA
jgi:hypothetical protein